MAYTPRDQNTAADSHSDNDQPQKNRKTRKQQRKEEKKKETRKKKKQIKKQEQQRKENEARLLTAVAAYRHSFVPTRRLHFETHSLAPILSLDSAMN